MVANQEGKIKLTIIFTHEFLGFQIKCNLSLLWTTTGVMSNYKYFTQSNLSIWMQL